jgi:hypothetical protein
MKIKIVSILISFTFIITSSVTVALPNFKKDNLIINNNFKQNEFTTLITDMMDDIVIEVDVDGNIIWEKSIVIPTDAERLDSGNTLIADGNNERIIEVDANGIIVWQRTGIIYPYDAERLENGNTLIVDGFNNNVIEVDTSGTIVWQKTGLNRPHDAERLSNGNTLIVESEYPSRVIEVTSDGDIVWELGGFSRCKDAERLDNGNTLVCDDLNSSIKEFDSNKNIVWLKDDCVHPVDVERLPNGNTLITESAVGERVYEVDSGGNVVWEKSGLDLPVDAERIYWTELEIGDIVGGVGLSAEIKNNGPYEAKNVVWEIRITKGIIFIPSGGSIIGGPDNIQPLANLPIITFVLGIAGFLGFGPVTITVSAEADNAEYVEKSVNANVFIFFVFT